MIPWTAACQASLSITNSQSLLKLSSIELVIPSNHLILCHPLLLLPSIFSNIRVFSNELVLCIRWPQYWSFRFDISPSSEYSVLISFRIDWEMKFQWRETQMCLAGFWGVEYFHFAAGWLERTASTGKVPKLPTEPSGPPWAQGPAQPHTSWSSPQDAPLGFPGWMAWTLEGWRLWERGWL